jgi:NAD(P)H-hydrate epimerase
LRKAKKDSHKGENGRLLVCAGSRQYHGSLILAIRAAVRFCDLVYVYCDKENRALVQKLKQATPNIIVLDESALRKFLPRIDAILAGPGWEADAKNSRLLSRLLKTKKPVVLDATALRMLKPKDLRAHAPGLCSHVLITPHQGEFKELFGMSATPASVLAMARKYDCTILAKGPVDYISDGVSFCANRVHHVGMTKGGTGDVLAGLTAALVAGHNGLFRSACAAAYLNGLAGVRLAKKMGAHYSSADLADELPLAAKSIEKR